MATLPPPNQREGATAHSEAEAGRREMKKALSTGGMTLQGLFDASDSEEKGQPKIAGHMHLRAALLALPKIGDKKANKILDGLGLAHDTHVAKVGKRQRKAVIQGVFDA